jgi:hypothetical protein
MEVDVTATPVYHRLMEEKTNISAITICLNNNVVG